MTCPFCSPQLSALFRARNAAKAKWRNASCIGSGRSGGSRSRSSLLVRQQPIRAAPAQRQCQVPKTDRLTLSQAPLTSMLMSNNPFKVAGASPSGRSLPLMPPPPNRSVVRSLGRPASACCFEQLRSPRANRSCQCCVSQQALDWLRVAPAAADWEQPASRLAGWLAVRRP